MRPPTAACLSIIILTLLSLSGNDLSAQYTGKEIDSLIETGQYRAAEEQLLKARSHQITAGNTLALGRLYRHMERWDEAETLLKKAKDLQKHFGEAYYELGCLYMEGPYLLLQADTEFKWGLKHNPDMLDAWYRRALIKQMERGYQASLTAFEPLMLRAPNFRSTYFRYSRMSLALHEYGKLIKFLPKLIEVYPDSAEYVMDYVEALICNRDYDRAMTVLKDKRQQLQHHSKALWYKHYASALIPLKQPESAWQAYEKGMKAITGQNEAVSYFKDVQAIATDEEYGAFKKLDSLWSDYFITFWKSRDPFLTTAHNERYVEHIQRLHYVLQHCRRWPEKARLDFFMTDLADPNTPKDLLMNRLSETEGSRMQGRLDDVGIIYLRHGDPDKFYTLCEPGVMMNLSWAYDAVGERPAMVFHFHRSQRPGGLSLLRPRRLHLGWVLSPRPLYPGDWTSYIKPEEVYESVGVATSTTTTDIKPSVEIRFDWDVYKYLAEGNQCKTVFCYELPEKIDGKIPDSTELLQQELVLFGPDWSELGRIQHSDGTAGTDKSRIRQLSFNTPPGHYFAGFRMHHTGSGAAGNTRFELEAKNSLILTLSDVMLGPLETNLPLFGEEYTSQSLAMEMKPNLRRVFRQGETLVIYFEIYNLEPDVNGRTQATIQFTLHKTAAPRHGVTRLFKKPRPISAVTLEQSANGRTSTEYILQSLALTDATPGEYELEIKVDDKHSIIFDRKTIPLTIVEGSGEKK